MTFVITDEEVDLDEMHAKECVPNWPFRFQLWRRTTTKSTFGEQSLAPGDWEYVPGEILTRAR
jgi:hypothetical protein